jgi:hypothetical protein
MLIRIGHFPELQRSRLTLRSLALHGDAHINYGSENIAGLSDFHVLDHVDVPLNALLPNDTDVGYISLSNRLPKSVRSLSLIWVPCITFDDFGIQVLALVVSHSLRKFVLRSAPRAHIDNDIDMCVYENIQSACESAGVEWSVEYDYWY